MGSDPGSSVYLFLQKVTWSWKHRLPQQARPLLHAVVSALAGSFCLGPSQREVQVQRDPSRPVTRCLLLAQGVRCLLLVQGVRCPLLAQSVRCLLLVQGVQCPLLASAVEALEQSQKGQAGDLSAASVFSSV